MRTDFCFLIPVALQKLYQDHPHSNDIVTMARSISQVSKKIHPSSPFSLISDFFVPILVKFLLAYLRITYQHNSFPMINIKVSTSRFWFFLFFTAPFFADKKDLLFITWRFFSNVYSSSLNPINFIPPYFSANMHTIFKLDSPFV